MLFARHQVIIRGNARRAAGTHPPWGWIGYGTLGNMADFTVALATICNLCNRGAQ
jgi:hypothetical protein